MMNYHPFYRGLLATLLYGLLFGGLVFLQFSHHSAFTLSVASMVVSGKYEDQAPRGAAEAEGRKLSGPLSVMFGGMEFNLSSFSGFSAINAAGKTQDLDPVRFEVDGEALTVFLSEGSRLVFRSVYVSGGEALQVQADISGSSYGIDLPFRALHSSRLAESTSGQLTISHGGSNYRFEAATIRPDKRVLYLNRKTPSFAYSKIAQRKESSPVDYILAEARDVNAYTNTLQRWRSAAMTGWERAMGGTPDEETVAAYVSESLWRSSFRAAIATTPKAFIDDQSRGYRTAAYFGRLDVGLRSLIASERETLGRISRLANERSPELFAEQNLVAFLGPRASRTLVEDIASYARAFDPAQITLTGASGILECWTEWRELYPDRENPFARLADQAVFVISASLRAVPGKLLLPQADDKVSAARALRAGSALMSWGVASGDLNAAALGRSVILSLLVFADANGTVPVELSFPSGAASPTPSSNRLQASAIYSALSFQRTQARRLLDDGVNPLWAWTCASNVKASREGAAIVISADFAVGDTHYMIIRGVKPFERLQLYGIDFRTDHRFERYDSSGWMYAPEEQALLVKMKHRQATEQIRIFYSEPQQ